MKKTTVILSHINSSPFTETNKQCDMHLVSSSFMCGKERVYGDDKCKTQCSICKKDYNES